MTAPTSGAAIMPSHHGIPALLTRVVVVSAPIIRNSPCAMFTTRMSPKTTANPIDASSSTAIAENADMATTNATSIASLVEFWIDHLVRFDVFADEIARSSANDFSRGGNLRDFFDNLVGLVASHSRQVHVLNVAVACGIQLDLASRTDKGRSRFESLDHSTDF